MRANWDSSVISAIAGKIKALGLRKPFLQSSQQFIYNTFLSYQQAAETCLPYTLLAGPKNPEGHTYCWAGVGLHVGWYGGLAITEFFQRRTGDLAGVALVVNIQPFFDQISDLLDPIPDPLIAEARALFAAQFEQTRSERPNEPPVPDGSSFDRAIVLEGAIVGPLAVMLIHAYLHEQYPGHNFQRSTLREHADRSFDVIDFTTVDGKSKTLYFALSRL